jgi:signal transduction histidine kinase/CheY-like chemotaxis protein
LFKVLLCVAHRHDWRLVALAAFVCVAATLSTFFLYGKTPLAPRHRRWTWLVLSGIAAGSGVWTTHFVAMLAFQTGLPTAYALGPTLASLAVAIASTIAGFAVDSVGAARRRTVRPALAGGLIVGVGITAMHYIGMLGYRTAGWIQWDGLYVAGSIAVGGAFSAAAMAVGRPGSPARRILQAAGLLALGIVGMHFTGMTAVTVVPDGSIAVPVSDISDRALASIAVAVTATILLAAVAGAALDAAGRLSAVRRLREALDAMPDAVAIFDRDDRLSAWNTPYAQICRSAGDLGLIAGARFEDLIGQGLAAGVFPDAHGREADWLAEIRALHAGERPSALQRTRDGRWLHITVRRTNDGGCVSTWSDVTELKRAEAGIAQARAEAEAAARVKSEFLANMSHELRTPLTSIIGFTGLAAEQQDLSPLTREYVDRVADASRALLCTVNDILDFSKLEAGQVVIQPKPSQVAPLCRATLDLFTPQAGAKDVRLVLDHGESVRTLTACMDPDRVRQVLLNLVSNAVKFTAEGSVTLRTCYDREAARLKVVVIDTGPGLTPDQQARLFQRFSQINGSLTRQGGTGLGLAICKGLVEAMGGEIGVESRLGEGSSFWFSIPAPAAAADAAEGADDAPARLSFEGVRVLVVDDHATNRELVRLFLSGVGAEVAEAADGVEAVESAGELPFDVILMDLRMPRLDGAAALARIRAEAGPNEATPILAFTADATAEIAERLLAEGFDDVVAKPLEPAALIAAVARATTFATPAAKDLTRPEEALSHAG